MTGQPGARMRLTILIAMLCLLPASPPSFAQSNFDRPGGDYQRTPVTSGDPVDCALLCEHDRRCRAWSFSYPTAGAPEATCSLKSTIPPRVANTCCVSGVHGAGVIEKRVGAIEMSTDRSGGDYHTIEMKPTDSDELCKDACEADSKCRAWTYVRTGYIGKDARCFLKNQIKPPHRKPGFTSGVVR